MAWALILIGTALLCSQVFRAWPIPIVVLLGAALVVSGYALLREGRPIRL
jgi:hypothetical protein